MTGETISHYRITDELGRGGMGIVYRAEDTKLDRTVALKLLPASALTSEDDRARFYREARAAASLSHPNIAHVYEIDEAVAGGESRPFIAMEYIDGESLAERIARGPLPIKDAISIATQIAEGLKAAHEKNVVHRDIKSGNVMLTKSGVVKILDFGLAKTAASTKLTQLGSTVGTIAYMSPEQARAEEVDRRTDIWSLGVILYEMITGQLPFKGDYEQAVVYGILNADPESMTAVRAGVPLALDAIVAKALMKDRLTRYQNVDELPADLKSVDLSPSTHVSRLGRSASYSVGKQESLPQKTRISAALLLIGALLGALVGAAVTWLIVPSANTQDSPVRRYVVLDPASVRGLEDPLSLNSSYISPDGSRIAFRADRRLWLRSLDNLEAVPVPGTEDSGGLEWSPDGTSLGFWKDDSYQLLSIASNEVKVLGYDQGWWEFLPDGSVATSHDDRIWGPIEVGTEPKPLIAPVPGLKRFGGFAPSKTGDTFFVIRTDSNATERIVAASKDGFLDLVTLPSGARAGDLVLAPSSHLLFTLERDNTTGVWAVSLDADGTKITGGPTVVVRNGRDPSVSEQGTLVYVETDTPDIEAVFLDETEREFRRGEVGKGAWDPSLSPDSRKMVYVRGSELWVKDLELGGDFKLTDNLERPQSPSWSPNSDHIVFHAGDHREEDIYIQSLRNGSEPVVLVEADESLRLPSWTADGDWILYVRYTKETNTSEIWRIRSDGSSDPEYVFSDRYVALFPQVSQDGKWLAYLSSRSGEWAILLTTYPQVAEPQRIETNNSPALFVWRGGYLYFSPLPFADLFRIGVGLNDLWVGDSDLLHSFDQGAFGSAEGAGKFDLSHDQKTLVLFRETTERRVPRVVAVENWLSTVEL